MGGVGYRVTGRPPHFDFAGGSFANGGAMRIWPLGIAFRHAPALEMRRAVEESIRSSHVHEEAVDGAIAVAMAVSAAIEHHEYLYFPASVGGFSEEAFRGAWSTSFYPGG